MQAVNLIITIFLFVSASLSTGAQSLDLFSPHLPDFGENYKECAAIIFDGNLLVDKYTPEGKCELKPRKEGTIAVSTVDLSNLRGTPGKRIGFRVAIKNGRTKTMWMYSEKTLYSIEMKDIIKKCEPGDNIVIMTVDQQYSLPHNEIELIWDGC